MIVRLFLLIGTALCQDSFNNQYGYTRDYNNDPYNQNNQNNQNNQMNNQMINQYQQQNGRQVVNQFLTRYDDPTMQNNGTGVTIQFQLRGYSNPGFLLSGNTTCVCPTMNGCNYLQNKAQCKFGFTFIISSPDTSVRYEATPFILLNDRGELESSVMSPQWSNNFVVQLPSKPSAIDVFAHNLGPVINSQTGNLVSVDTYTHADTFVIPLNDVIPAVGGVQNMNEQYTFRGKLIGTSLRISYSIACSGALIGPNCDLSCVRSEVSNSVAACRSNSTGFYMICQYQNDQQQVNNCKNCPWGIKDSTYCQDEKGKVLDPKNAGVVGDGYFTATVILGILCLVLLLIAVFAIVAFCLSRRRKPEEKEMKVFERSEGPAHQPLLQAQYRAEVLPSPAIRSQPPSLDMRPVKSSLKKNQLSGLNDTRDSAFSGSGGSDVPMRPSRSEVV